MENLSVEILLKAIKSPQEPIYYIDTELCPEDQTYGTKACYIFHPKHLELFLQEAREVGLNPISVRDNSTVWIKEKFLQNSVEINH